MKWFLIIVTFAFISLIGIASAWDDCPFGMVNDTYPGECSRYIDTDGDGICDHSQPSPVERSYVSAISSTKKTLSLDNKLLLQLAITFIITLLLALLFKFAISARTANYIWNILLLILFVISAVSGLLTVLAKNVDFILLHRISSFLLLWAGLYHIIKHRRYYIPKR